MHYESASLFQILLTFIIKIENVIVVLLLLKEEKKLYAYVFLIMDME